MMLYVNGQDIKKFVLGCLDDRHGQPVFVHGPEMCEREIGDEIRMIERALEKWGVDPGGIEGVVAVRGPGSSTALRTTLSLLNAWTWARGIAMYPVEKAIEIDDGDAFVGARHAVPVRRVPFAIPLYAHDPRITVSKRDALRRKTA